MFFAAEGFTYRNFLMEVLAVDQRQSARIRLHPGGIHELVARLDPRRDQHSGGDQQRGIAHAHDLGAAGCTTEVGKLFSSSDG